MIVTSFRDGKGTDVPGLSFHTGRGTKLTLLELMIMSQKEFYNL